MATLVKEKRREKKRSKEKPKEKGMEEGESSSFSDISKNKSEVLGNVVVNSNDIEINADNTPEQHNVPGLSEQNIEMSSNRNMCDENIDNVEENAQNSKETEGHIAYEEAVPPVVRPDVASASESSKNNEQCELAVEEANSFEQCEKNLEQEISEAPVSMHTEQYVCMHNFLVDKREVPSAPMMDEVVAPGMYERESFSVKAYTRLQSVPIEEALKIFGNTEFDFIRAISDSEEAIVDKGPTSGPDHPLFDLLATFRRSLIAVERERNVLTVNFAEEEKFRSTLWKVEKKYITETMKCPCGLDVTFNVKYDYAELQTEKLPIARMKLEGLLKDLQESFCHHQHAAVFAHSQIENAVMRTSEGDVSEIREAMMLLFKALKLSDSAPAILGRALQRWISMLAIGLLIRQDWKNMMFYIHHLFRQSRSLRWAARPVTIYVIDAVSAARTIAMLKILFTKTTVESAIECVEDNRDETWEEVDKHGDGGAVCEGSLRERDLIAFLRAIPLMDLVVSILLFEVPDVTAIRDCHWDDRQCGWRVLRASCGVRALLQACAAVRGHYTRLRRTLAALVLPALQGLGALHLHISQKYAAPMKIRVLAELQAVFVAAFQFIEPSELHKIPTVLLADYVARDFCNVNMMAIEQHGEGSGPHRVESLDIDLPAMTCDQRVRIIAHASAHRLVDYELARFVIDCLYEIGIKRLTSSMKCRHKCRQAAREVLPILLKAHPYLYPIMLHQVAETYASEKLEPSDLDCMALNQWKPPREEVRAVFDDWVRRCPPLLQRMLVLLEYTPHIGLSLDTQLVIGDWLCKYVDSKGGVAEEWCWSALRRLRVSRSFWVFLGPTGQRLAGAPEFPEPFNPDPEPKNLFSKAYALLATSWGHCVPVICSVGIEALCDLAASRAVEAVHCLSPIMIQMAKSPESLATTPRFTDLFTILLNSTPSLVQRALGRGGATGADLLLYLVQEQLEKNYCGGVSQNTLAELWIVALWGTSPALATILDTALLPPAFWEVLQYRAYLISPGQDENSRNSLEAACGWGSTAPLVSARALWAARENARGPHRPLLAALHQQRQTHQRIHVDNAIAALMLNISSEDLVIYRAANAVLAAPHTHPAHLILWQIFLNLYLERPEDEEGESLPPVGMLFFSGIVKTRTFNQLKKKLQETITYHSEQSAAMKIKMDSITSHIKAPVKSVKKTTVETLTCPLTLTKLAGISCDESDSESEETEDQMIFSVMDENDELFKAHNLAIFHDGAQKMLKKFYGWIEQAEATRALPQHAEISRFIPEKVLGVAFIALALQKQPSIPEEVRPGIPPAFPPPIARPALTVTQEAAEELKKLSKLSKIQSHAIADYDFFDDTYNNCESLITVANSYLTKIGYITRQWQSDVETLSTLDSRLMELIRSLRVPKPLPTVHSACANKCKPLAFTPPDQEWCILTGASDAIIENRKCSKVGIRHLTQPRSYPAQAACYLLTIVRRLQSLEEACQMAELVWRASNDVAASCPPIASLLLTLLEELAERWLVTDAGVCAALLSRWCSVECTNLQQTSIGALVQPSRAKSDQIPELYSAILNSKLPPPVIFSKLSKFELGSWSQKVDSATRRKLLDFLTSAVQKWGPTPSTDCQLLVELFGVQTVAVCTALELCPLVRACAVACVKETLPALHLRYIVRTAELCAPQIPFDQLGHLLRELGEIWWTAQIGVRTVMHGRVPPYAIPITGLLQTLHRAFVKAAVALSYTPQKVSFVAWSSLQESWSAWVVPQQEGGSTRVRERHYEAILQAFTAAIRHVIENCPGSADYILEHVWQWAIETWQVIHATGGQTGRSDAAALLAELASLPWQQTDWLSPSALQALIQVSSSGSRELQAWCGARCAGRAAGAWRRAGRGGRALLVLLAASHVPFSHQVLKSACQLTWHELTEKDLEEVLDKFYVHHYSVVTPYHEIPQFRIMLSACGLLPSEEADPGEGVALEGGSSGGVSPNVRARRALGVSRWARAAATPFLAAHAQSHATAMLQTIKDLVPTLESSEGELADLLGRAMIVFCVEPIAAAVLPVWEQFILSAGPAIVRASLTAVAGLTVLEYFMTLAEAAIKTYMQQENASWSTVVASWENCAWDEVAPMCAKGKLHAAYATLLRTNTDTAVVGVESKEDGTVPEVDGAVSVCGDPISLRTALLALVAADINLSQNELIVAVWLCAACRIARSCSDDGDQAECAHAAQTLLQKWGDVEGNVLLRLVTSPTPRSYRLLSLFAQCVLSPGNETVALACEMAWGTGGGQAGGAALPEGWARAPAPRRLPRLALRLFPLAQNYFKQEYDMTPTDSAE